MNNLVDLYNKIRGSGTPAGAEPQPFVRTRFILPSEVPKVGNAMEEEKKVYPVRVVEDHSPTHVGAPLKTLRGPHKIVHSLPPAGVISVPENFGKSAHTIPSVPKKDPPKLAPPFKIDISAAK